MSFDEIKAFITNKFGEAVLVREQRQELMSYLVIQTDQIAAVCAELHAYEQLYFDVLSCQTGMDNGPAAGTLEVAYNLYSIPYNHQVCLKVVVNRNSADEPLPVVPTVSHIWRTADWHEREIFDLLGIQFSGHPDMRRILCAADWEGYPLRKDYEAQEYYHGIRVAFDEHNRNNGFKGEDWQNN
ncbi:NADH-quinone oxidoreductase subunit C [Adhaeribacter pallidiroseus]|uniref:NADH-quinone oxidoreductase subunit C n=1 Tax=Adhaeribacter pallidiroseus TaxID=2072847 RepID=A0A369QM63_9BACT|nr:NADH-quinone oxidoreductase subunit C [Adhaeribacter pallidiroseus]RDC66021.1 NADH:ubiquinone reductase (H(+)-translocating) [Adhaeribacter pallidiroseus]